MAKEPKKKRIPIDYVSLGLGPHDIRFNDTLEGYKAAVKRGKAKQDKKIKDSYGTTEKYSWQVDYY